ncbi:MAG: hypothetical protein OIF54_09780 [Cohaesibacter sp.]|nr:hypothetical protein [Cohaesibacter sp.]
MNFIAIVTASRNRRRAGINFPKRKEIPVKLTGEDDPRLAKLEADPALHVKVQVIEDEEDDSATSDKEDLEEKRRADLKDFLLELEEKPKVKQTSDAMGFKVTGAEIDELWAEIQDEKTLAS